MDQFIIALFTESKQSKSFSWRVWVIKKHNSHNCHGVGWDNEDPAMSTIVLSVKESWQSTRCLMYIYNILDIVLDVQMSEGQVDYIFLMTDLPSKNVVVQTSTVILYK